jgi:acyl-CoA reductase-like NAD-dependent aldehyde dehydrogenase
MASSSVSIAPTRNEINVSVPLWINGEQEPRQDTFDVFSPSLSSVCWTSASATQEDAIKAVEAAQIAFKSWSLTKPAYRTELLLKTAAILESNAEEYAGYMFTEMGAEIQISQFFVLPLAIQMLKDISGRVSSICGSVPVCQQDGQSGMVIKEPYGVTLGIVPW